MALKSFRIKSLEFTFVTRVLDTKMKGINMLLEGSALCKFFITFVARNLISLMNCFYMEFKAHLC